MGNADAMGAGFRGKGMVAMPYDENDDVTYMSYEEWDQVDERTNEDMTKAGQSTLAVLRALHNVHWGNPEYQHGLRYARNLVKQHLEHLFQMSETNTRGGDHVNQFFAGLNVLTSPISVDQEQEPVVETKQPDNTLYRIVRDQTGKLRQIAVYIGHDGSIALNINQVVFLPPEEMERLLDWLVSVNEFAYRTAGR